MKIESPQFIVDLLNEGIIHVHYKAGTKVTVQTLQELERVYAQMTIIKRPYIFTGEEFVSITNEARKYAAEMDRKIPSLGSVFVARNLAQKILAQYYFKFNKPAKPLTVVGNFEAGIAYIIETYELHPIS